MQHSDSIPFTMSSEVEEALREERPIIACDSAFAIHSLSYPDNIACVRASVAQCHEAGVALALIAVIDGTLTAGVSVDQLALKMEARSPLPSIAPEEIAIAMHAGWNGVLSGAALLAIASLAGIAICAAPVVDATANGAITPAPTLHSLARHPLLLVASALRVSSAEDTKRSAASTSHNDLPRQLGVATLGYRCDHYFCITSQSGARAPVTLRINEVEEAARIARLARIALRPAGLLLFPSELHEAPPLASGTSPEMRLSIQEYTRAALALAIKASAAHSQ